MPRKEDENFSRAKDVSVEESSSVMVEIPVVETWIAPAREITGEIVAAVETWTVPAGEMTGEIVPAVETWTVPARK